MRVCWMLLVMAVAPTVSAPAAGAGEPAERSYICSGNEPFWRIEITPTEAIVSRPGHDGTEQQVFDGSLSSFDYLDPPWSVWRGKEADEQGILVVVSRHERCSDTMADESVFDYRALVSFPEGGAASGCCNAIAALVPAGVPTTEPKPRPTKNATHLWPDLSPAIESCLAQVPVDAGTVVKAWPMNHGRIGVRLAGSGGERFDCIVIDGPNRVERIDALAANAPALPGERGPIFLPSGGDPPKVSCGYLGRVVDYRGATAGYLHYRDGCPHQ